MSDIPTPRTDAIWNQTAISTDELLARMHNHAELLEQECANLRSLISKSSLIEVDSVVAEPDSCGKPVLVPSGKILVHKDSRAQTEQRTKDLQKMASMAREIAVLQRWKAEQLQVESEWNPQEIAKLLGAKLGDSTRKTIQEAVPKLVEELAEANAMLDWLISEGAVVKHFRDQSYWVDWPWDVSKSQKGDYPTAREAIRAAMEGGK